MASSIESNTRPTINPPVETSVIITLISGHDSFFIRSCDGRAGSERLSGLFMALMSQLPSFWLLVINRLVDFALHEFEFLAGACANNLLRVGKGLVDSEISIRFHQVMREGYLVCHVDFHGFTWELRGRALEPADYVANSPIRTPGSVPARFDAFERMRAFKTFIPAGRGLMIIRSRPEPTMPPNKPRMHW
jgi:hypothetical protein